MILTSVMKAMTRSSPPQSGQMRGSVRCGVFARPGPYRSQLPDAPQPTQWHTTVLPGQPFHILVDSTGLKVYVDSEWRKHSNRRLWRKIHLVVDAQTGNILASELTTNKVGDASQVPILLAQIDESIGSVAADGAYDTQLVYDTLENHQASEPVTILIPPRRRARRSGSGAISSACRDRHIQFIEGHGRRRWQKESGFNGRNLVETAMYRYKAIIGGRLRARSLASQRTETKVACSILNRMTELGMPDSYRAA